MSTNRPEADHRSEPLWDAHDVAAYLKVSRSWVYQKTDAGLLPYIRVGALKRFSPRQIQEHFLGGRDTSYKATVLPFKP